MWGATKKFIEFTKRTETFPGKPATCNLQHKTLEYRNIL